MRRRRAEPGRTIYLSGSMSAAAAGRRAGQQESESVMTTSAGKPEAGKGEDDHTLGGYFAVHSRPPAFEAVDGQPYTVSIETEHTGNLKAPVAGYLVFPRWAATGLGIVGHVESPLLWWGDTRSAVVESARAATLNEVQRLLNEAVVARADSGERGR